MARTSMSTSTPLSSSQSSTVQIPLSQSYLALDPEKIDGHIQVGPIKLHELLNYEQIAGKRAQRIAKAQAESLMCRSWLKAQLGFYSVEPRCGTTTDDMIGMLKGCVRDELAARAARAAQMQSSQQSTNQSQSSTGSAPKKRKLSRWDQIAKEVEVSMKNVEQRKKERFKTLGTPAEEANFDTEMFLNKYFSGGASVFQEPIALPGLLDRDTLRQAAAHIPGLETTCVRQGTSRVLVIGWDCNAADAEEAVEFAQQLKEQHALQKAQDEAEQAQARRDFEKAAKQRKLQKDRERKKSAEAAEERKRRQILKQQKALIETEEQCLGWAKDMTTHNKLVKALPTPSPHHPQHFSIGQTEGEYTIACSKIRTGYLAPCDKMSLSIAYDTELGWTASFDFGLIDGMMRLETDTSELITRCYAAMKGEVSTYNEEEFGIFDHGMQMDIAKEEAQWRVYKSDAESAFARHHDAACATRQKYASTITSSTTTPAKRRRLTTPIPPPTPEETIPPRIIYFKWRGRETRENLIEQDEGNNFGHLLFTDATCTAFEGAFDSVYFGDEVAFQGFRVGNKGGKVTKDWSHYSEVLFPQECRGRLPF